MQITVDAERLGEFPASWRLSLLASTYCGIVKIRLQRMLVKNGNGL